MQMYCPASKWCTSPFPVVYSPATCAWCLTLSFSSFLWQKGHKVVKRKSFSTFDVLSNGSSSKRYLFTLFRAIVWDTPWKDEDLPRSRVVYGILAVGCQWLECETRLNRTTWLACVCLCHQWLTRSQRTRRPVLAFRIAGWWIADVFAAISIQICNVHLSYLHVPISLSSSISAWSTDRYWWGCYLWIHVRTFEQCWTLDSFIDYGNADQQIDVPNER